MNRKVRVKSKYGTLKRGTKRRQIALLLIRPQGCSALEAYIIVGFNSSLLGCEITRLKDDYGFDIQIIDKRKPNSKDGRGRNQYVWRIIGRWRWNGSYRSFL